MRKWISWKMSRRNDYRWLNDILAAAIVAQITLVIISFFVKGMFPRRDGEKYRNVISMARGRLIFFSLIKIEARHKGHGTELITSSGRISHVNLIFYRKLIRSRNISNSKPATGRNVLPISCN
jgi:hypothetical protein